MTSDKKRKLQMTLAGIQKRWGTTAVGLLRDQPSTIPHISTGFSMLDEALGVGGIPRGRISEIIGVPTSGMATVALKIIANAQNQRGTAVFMDLEQTFDPDYADHCGVRLNQLVLVRPQGIEQALAMLPDFIINGGMDILVFDNPLHLHTGPTIKQTFSQSLTKALGRLIAPLSKIDCALLFLTTLLPQGTPSLMAYPPHMTLPHYATVRLLIQKERWLYRQRDISGYQAQVLIAKNKLSSAGQTAHITITFKTVMAGDTP